MISGAMAGAVASAVTTPLDVCKTLLNTQERSALNTLGRSQISGLVLAFRTVYRIGGPKAYFQVRGKSQRFSDNKRIYLKINVPLLGALCTCFVPNAIYCYMLVNL